MKKTPSEIINANDILEIEKSIKNLDKIIDKYGLQVNNPLFHLSIFNNEKYPNSLFRKIDEKTNYNIVDKQKQTYQYPSKYIDTSEAFRYYLNRKLISTDNKRRWISIKKISDDFSKWYSVIHNEDIKSNVSLYKVIINTFNDMSIRVTKMRITGYCLLD